MPDLDRIHQTAAAYDAILHRKSPPPTMLELHQAQAALNRALNDIPDPEPLKIPTPDEIKAMKPAGPQPAESEPPTIDELLAGKSSEKSEPSAEV